MAEEHIPRLAPWRKNSPFTREEWAELQRWRDGESKDERELRLHRARYAKRLEKDPTHRKAQRNKWRAENADRERKVAKVWSANNPESLKARQKRYYHRHKEARLDSYRKWCRANPERVRERNKAWYAANPGMNAFYSSKWRKAAFRATPPWADMDAIRGIYEECARDGYRGSRNAALAMCDPCLPS